MFDDGHRAKPLPQPPTPQEVRARAQERERALNAPPPDRAPPQAPVAKYPPFPPAIMPNTPTSAWFRKAVKQCERLQSAPWVREVKFRSVGSDVVRATKFRDGFEPNDAPVSVGMGQSRGGVATGSLRGATRMLEQGGERMFLLCVEGFDLESVDRQNRLGEVMCHQVESSRIVACADDITMGDEGYGSYFEPEYTSGALHFNDAFQCPQGFDWDMIDEGMKAMAAKLGLEKELPRYEEWKKTRGA